jgi:hypothetical protein
MPRKPRNEDEDRPQPRIAGKTTYFLGAGFSAAAGIPTMPCFVREAFRLLKRYGPKSLCEELARIVDKYRSIAAGPEINIEDIQELFSLVSGNHPKRPNKNNPDESKTLRAVIALTICFAELEDRCRMDMMKNERSNLTVMKIIEKQIKHDDLLHNSHQNWKSQRTVPWRHLFPANEEINSVPRSQPFCGDLLNSCIYEAFFSYVLRRSKTIGEGEKADYADVIVTPNYDLTVERAATNLQYPCEIDCGECFPLGQKIHKLKLVKLHGSLDWRLNKEKLETWKPLEQLHKAGESFEQFRIADLKTVINEWGQIRIIPPTWQYSESKGRHQTDVLFKSLRKDALQHLREAERIVIVGYSMPKTDLHIKALMAHALDTPDRPAIEVWDIEEYEKMKERLENMFGKTLAATIEYDKGGRENGGLKGFVRKHPFIEKPE